MPQPPNLNYTKVAIGMKLYVATEAYWLWQAAYDGAKLYNDAFVENAEILNAILNTSLTAAIVHGRCLLDIHDDMYKPVHNAGTTDSPRCLFLQILGPVRDWRVQKTLHRWFFDAVSAFAYHVLCLSAVVFKSEFFASV